MSETESRLPSVLPRYIAEQLGADIEQGKLPPGIRLNEANVARQFGTSRGPVREAFAILAKEDLVELRPRYGAFVVNLTLAQVGEMFEMRGALFALAVRLFTRIATEAQIDEVARLVDEASRLAGVSTTTPSESARANQAISGYVVANAGNPRLLDTMTKMTRQAFRHYAELANSSVEHRREIAAAAQRTLAAIRRRDAEAASASAWLGIEANDAAVRAALGSAAAADHNAAGDTSVKIAASSRDNLANRSTRE